MAYNIKAAIRAAKNMQYEPIEVQVREATNNDPWGVSTAVMSDIARATHQHDDYPLLFKMLWKRLNDRDHVMHVQKALILTDYLLRNGAERFINDAKRRARDISALQKYKQYDANNRDVGGEVRAKAKSVYELLTNDAKLAEERERAQAIRDARLSGMGSDGYGPHGDDDHRGGGGSGGRERGSHQERFTEGDGGDSPNADDDDRETGEYAPPVRKTDGADEETERTSEHRKKKKDRSSRDKEKADKDKDNDEPAAETSEKKKKKKKKKSSADAAPSSSASAAAAEAAVQPASGSASPAPAAHAASSSVSQFDSLVNGSHSAPTAGVSISAFQPAAAVAAPSAADKPKKSRKSKKGEAAEAADAAATAASAGSSGDYDLTTFAALPSTGGLSSSDLDILTGTNAPVGLEDMFAASSIMDEPLDAGGDGAAGGEEEDGFVVDDEPALLDMIQQQSATAASLSPRGAGGAQAEAKKPSDVWDLAADFTNIDNLTGSVVRKKQGQKEEVSMSMMRSMQPFGGGGGGAAAASLPATSSSLPPPSVSPFFAVPAAGGFGGAMPPFIPVQVPVGMGMAGPPAFGGLGGGFGTAAAAGGAAGMPVQPQPGIGPFVSLGGFGMGGAGAAAGAPQSGLNSDLPFAAPSSAAQSRNRMPANGKPVIFDSVPQARSQPAQPQQQTGGPTGPRWNR